MSPCYLGVEVYREASPRSHEFVKLSASRRDTSTRNDDISPMLFSNTRISNNAPRANSMIDYPKYAQNLFCKPKTTASQTADIPPRSISLQIRSGGLCFRPQASFRLITLTPTHAELAHNTQHVAHAGPPDRQYTRDDGELSCIVH